MYKLFVGLAIFFLSAPVSAEDKNKFWNFDNPVGTFASKSQQKLVYWELIQFGCFHNGGGVDMFTALDEAKKKQHVYLRQRIGPSFDEMLLSLTNSDSNNQFFGWSSYWFMDEVVVKQLKQSPDEFCKNHLKNLNNPNRYIADFNEDLVAAGYSTTATKTDSKNEASIASTTNNEGTESTTLNSETTDYKLQFKFKGLTKNYAPEQMVLMDKYKVAGELYDKTIDEKLKLGTREHHSAMMAFSSFFSAHFIKGDGVLRNGYNVAAKGDELTSKIPDLITALITGDGGSSMGWTTSLAEQITNWTCYVTSVGNDFHSGVTCSIFTPNYSGDAETIVDMISEQVDIYLPKDAEGPKVFVGDQIQISGKNLYLKWFFDRSTLSLQEGNLKDVSYMLINEDYIEKEGCCAWDKK